MKNPAREEVDFRTGFSGLTPQTGVPRPYPVRGSFGTGLGRAAALLQGGQFAASGQRDREAAWTKDTTQPAKQGPIQACGEGSVLRRRDPIAHIRSVVLPPFLEIRFRALWQIVAPGSPRCLKTCGGAVSIVAGIAARVEAAAPLPLI